MKKLLLLMIRFYQQHKPQRLKNVCIYTPSCSEYSRQAILKYGALEGLKRSVKRIRSCQASATGGIDHP